jgi:hypothetical protein
VKIQKEIQKELKALKALNRNKPTKEFTMSPIIEKREETKEQEVPSQVTREESIITPKLLTQADVVNSITGTMKMQPNGDIIAPNGTIYKHGRLALIDVHSEIHIAQLMSSNGYFMPDGNVVSYGIGNAQEKQNAIQMVIEDIKKRVLVMFTPDPVEQPTK